MVKLRLCNLFFADLLNFYTIIDIIQQITQFRFMCDKKLA